MSTYSFCISFKVNFPGISLFGAALNMHPASFPVSEIAALAGSISTVWPLSDF